MDSHQSGPAVTFTVRRGRQAGWCCNASEFHPYEFVTFTAYRSWAVKMQEPQQMQVEVRMRVQLREREKRKGPRVGVGSGIRGKVCRRRAVRQ